MSDELLRRAAAQMRERAQVMPEGPWEVMRLQLAGRGVVAQSHEDGICVTDDLPLPDVEYIASWHPGVALAVADWLDSEANLWSHVNPYEKALAVARAYLGDGNA